MQKVNIWCHNIQVINVESLQPTKQPVRSAAQGKSITKTDTGTVKYHLFKTKHPDKIYLLILIQDESNVIHLWCSPEAHKPEPSSFSLAK